MESGDNKRVMGTVVLQISIEKVRDDSNQQIDGHFSLAVIFRVQQVRSIW